MIRALVIPFIQSTFGVLASKVDHLRRFGRINQLAEKFDEIKSWFEDDKEDGVTEFEKADLAEDFRRYSRRYSRR